MSITGPPKSVNQGALLALLVFWVSLKAWLVVGVDLGKDEAAYWYWARYLDASYAFVPLAAIAVADALAPVCDLALRAPFLLAGALSVALMFGLCRATGLDARRSAYAAAALATSHWLWHTSSFLHPDGFLVPTWLLALLCTVRASRGDGDGWWVGAGLAVGLAALSKYTGLVLAAGWFAALLMHSREGGVRPLALAAVPFSILATPLLLDLLRTGFALPHALSSLSAVGPESIFLRGLLYPLAPLLYVSPPLLWVLYRGLGRRIRGGWRDDERGLVWPGLFLLLFFAGFALTRGQLKGNWLLPAFLGLWPAAFQPAAFAPAPAGAARHRRCYPALLLAIGLVHAGLPALSLRAPALTGWLTSTPLRSLDATYAGTVSAADLPREPTFSWVERVCEYHGWPAFGATVDSLVAISGRGGPIVATSVEYGLAFGLARYADSVEAATVPGDPRFTRLGVRLGEGAGVHLEARRLTGAPGAGAAVVRRGTGAGCPPLAYELRLRP